MLSLYEYSALTANQQAELLWQEGDFLMSVMEEEIGYNLYSLYDFYIEVKLVDNWISEMTSFKMGPRLDKYLPFIELTNR